MTRRRWARPGRDGGGEMGPEVKNGGEARESVSE